MAEKLHAVAEAYGQRPSRLLRGSWADFDLDFAVLALARKAQADAREQAQTPAPAQGSAAALMAAFPGLRMPAPATPPVM